MTYNNEWVINLFDQDKPLTFLFFWGHQPRKDNTIGKSCLSQWFVSPFNSEGILYPTAEHWMMAQKAKLFRDDEIFKQIIETNSARKVKALGRKVHHFEPKIWQEESLKIVIEGNYLKFSQNKNLKEFLLSTDNRILVEASPNDNIWGIGLSEQAKDVKNPHTWKGTNKLGYALMAVRDKLRKE